MGLPMAWANNRRDFSRLFSHLEMAGDDMMTRSFKEIQRTFHTEVLRISMDFSSTRALLRASGQNALLSHLHHCLHLAACDS